MANINIKKGSYADKAKLKNDGDIGFAKYNSNTGTFIVNDGGTLVNLMPAPGASDKPLVGQGTSSAPTYKTLPVAGGGTGRVTLSSGKVLVGNGTSAVDLRAITNNTSAAQSISASTNLITANTLAYWNGAYSPNGNSFITNVGTITKGTWNATSIDIAHGGTGATTAAAARANLGLEHFNKEAYLTWGGRHISASVSPVDVAMSQNLSANRFALAKAAGVTVEYSTNGGSTYQDYGLTNTDKINLISGIGSSIKLGKKSSGVTNTDTLRITLSASQLGVYTRLRKILVNVSVTTGIKTPQVKIEKSTIGTPNIFTQLFAAIGVGGDTAWNSIALPVDFAFGGSASYQCAKLRLTFSCAADSNGSFTILDIMGFGDTYWNYPSQMSKTGHLYGYDANGNASFPGKISASSFDGNATSATKVNNNLVIKLNSGATENTNLFTFNGSTAKTIDITPAKIGAAAASHTHSYAGSSAAGGAANSSNKLELFDTREINEKPLEVIGAKGIRFDFKKNSAIGISDEGSYSTIQNIRQWGDQSGGKSTQIAYSDSGAIRMRKGDMNTDTWGSWKTVAYTDSTITGAVNRTYLSDSIYHPSKGVLIDFNMDEKSGNMIILKLSGNSYGSGKEPIEAIYQFYDYASGDLNNFHKGISLSGPVIDLKIFRVNKKLKAWFQHPAANCTFKVEVTYGQASKVIPKITLSDDVEPTVEVSTNTTVTIVPKKVFSSDSTLTQNRLLTRSGDYIVATNNYVANGKLAIGSASAPSENLYVNGTSKITGAATVKTLTISDNAESSHIKFSRNNGINYLHVPDGGQLGVCIGDLSSDNCPFVVKSDMVFPYKTNTIGLGSSSYKWKHLYVGTGGLFSAGTIYPSTANSCNIGTANYIWKYMYGERYYTYDATNKYQGGSFYTANSADTTAQPTYLILGNSTATGTAGNRYGILRLYSAGAKYTDIIRPTETTDANYTLNLPGANGQLVYHTNDTVIGSSTQPVYIAKTGQATACDTSTSGAWFSSIPFINNKGIMGIGRYLDFHMTDTTTYDYSVRIDAGVGNGQNILYLPDITGQVVVHKNNSIVGGTYAPIYIAASGQATKCTSPDMIINLESTSTDIVFKASPRPGVTGILGIANGGTGATNPPDARAKLGAASITFITWGEDDTYATIDG